MFNDYARRNGFLKEKDSNLTGEDFREGLSCVLTTMVKNPQFEGQTKGRLGNSEVRPAVEGIITQQLTDWLENLKNQEIAQQIVQKAIRAAQGEPVHIIEELAECDFGEFENKNYKELEGNPHYQEWIASNGTLPVPGGDSREGCKSRNLRGFDRVVSGCIRSHVAEAALVIHGGTIMNIMEEYADIQKPFYEWHVRNGGGYEVELDENLWKNGRKQLRVNSAIRER